MYKKISRLSITGICLYSSIAMAGESGIQSMPTTTYRPMVSLLGGYASMNARNAASYNADDENIYIYTSRNSDKNTGFIGTFLGIEYLIPQSRFFVQGGVEYNYFGSVRVNGLHTAGAELATATAYTYNYNFQTQQVMASAKLLTTTYNILHPYAALGLGAAFNNTNKYRLATQETGSLNLTPTFLNRSSTHFSYNLGLGVDADVYEHIRVGIGYRYSNFGKASLGKGQIVFNNITYPTGFTLGSNNAYANQFIAQISYLA